MGRSFDSTLGDGVWVTRLQRYAFTKPYGTPVLFS